MKTPTRTLRDHADNLSGAQPQRSAKEMDQQERILAAAQCLMARFGRSGLTMGDFATAIRMSPATIRKHFLDLDSILAELLSRHLVATFRAIGEIPRDAINRQQQQRAAYLAYTRPGYNAPSEAHVLLLRERCTLPPDLADPIERLRDQLGAALAGEFGAAALALLDTTELLPPQIEAMLSALAQPAAEPKAPSQAAAAPRRHPSPHLTRSRPHPRTRCQENPPQPLAQAAAYQAAAYQARAGPAA